VLRPTATQARSRPPGWSASGPVLPPASIQRAAALGWPFGFAAVLGAAACFWAEAEPKTAPKPRQLNGASREAERSKRAGRHGWVEAEDDLEEYKDPCAYEAEAAKELLKLQDEELLKMFEDEERGATKKQKKKKKKKDMGAEEKGPGHITDEVRREDQARATAQDRERHKEAQATSRQQEAQRLLHAAEEARREAARATARELEAQRLDAEEARREMARATARLEARLEAQQLAAEEARREEARATARLVAEEAQQLAAEAARTMARLEAEEARREEAQAMARQQEAQRLAAEDRARFEAARATARQEAQRLAAEEARHEAARETARQEAQRLAAAEALRVVLHDEADEERFLETQRVSSRAQLQEAADAALAQRLQDSERAAAAAAPAAVADDYVQVDALLKSLGLLQLRPAFVEHQVDDGALACVDVSDLRAMGLAIGPARKIFFAARRAEASPELAAALECPICFEATTALVALVPCGHRTCVTCAGELGAGEIGSQVACPTCRRPVASTLRLY